MFPPRWPPLELLTDWLDAHPRVGRYVRIFVVLIILWGLGRLVYIGANLP